MRNTAPMLFALLAVCQSVLAKPVEVIIGGYQFPPYVIETAEGINGVVPEITAALNKISDRYQFSFAPTSIENRYQAFARHRFDIILFENPSWGWEQFDKAIVKLKVADGEVFVGHMPEAAKPGYFDDLSEKSLLLVRGYHYEFNGFETREAELRQRYRLELVPDNRAALEGLLLNRADIAPISISFLGWYLHQHPQKAATLKISNRWDQHYRHVALLHPQSPISASDLEALMHTLETNGMLETILKRYQLNLAR
ncbi:transporter substrate-binding domain-containing protein [Shewanella sp. JM162201]|uniref:Transporter substrate-binding domain-containing protein n=1 Tax=Shewanella jiangmenensis TaxID=2837387 RepID=A0ABS5UZY5_9GAMM|nr:transporter substrate-binding domain-containing protein [Shewanella jiangmenensis]MBT1442921.1 transporter substrate-binding domain-containing protein [Shewanella jiangmenensis]